MDHREPTTRRDVDEIENANPNREEPNICAICRNEPPINGVSLDCYHVFCYLCIKGVAETTGCCPLCRREIALDFDYQDHCIVGVARIPRSHQGYYWFYEGFRGWWLFDAETNNAIEDAYNQGTTHLERFIAGHIYQIDLESMVQKRRDGDGRTRKIRRDKLDLDNILGMGGIRGKDFEEYLEMMKTNDQLEQRSTF